MQGTQLNLFSAVLHAYSKECDGTLDNRSLYAQAAEFAGIPPADTVKREPVGAAGSKHNLYARKVRWYQQTLKRAGILEKVNGERGVWSLTKPAAKDLNQIEPTVSVLGFSTDLGIAILGTCESVFASVDDPITLVVTSPPYPLSRPRSYGNPTEPQYVDWICRTLDPVIRNLARGGSICLNVSNDVFLPESPARSLYCERLLLELNSRFSLHLMDRLVWRNPSKPPGPYQYASRARTQLNVEYEHVFWLTNDPHRVKSDNRRVLQAHTEQHLKLIQRGGEARTASAGDGAYRLRPGSFGRVTEGRIPRNVLSFGHRCGAQVAYKQAARERGLPIHSAPMPLSLASFLVEFLSEPGDLVADPFGGSFTTADAAERLGRRWLSTECMVEYVIGGATRFENAAGFRMNLPWQGASAVNGSFALSA